MANTTVLNVVYLVFLHVGHLDQTEVPLDSKKNVVAAQGTETKTGGVAARNWMENPWNQPGRKLFCFLNLVVICRTSMCMWCLYIYKLYYIILYFVYIYNIIIYNIYAHMYDICKYMFSHNQPYMKGNRFLYRNTQNSSTIRNMFQPMQCSSVYKDVECSNARNFLWRNILY